MINWIRNEIKKVHIYLKVNDLFRLKMFILTLIFFASTFTLNYIYNDSIKKVEIKQAEIAKLHDSMDRIKKESLVFLIKEQVILYEGLQSDLYSEKKRSVVKYRLLLETYQLRLIKEAEKTGEIDNINVTAINVLFESKKEMFNESVNQENVSTLILDAQRNNVRILQKINFLIESIESDIRSKIKESNKDLHQGLNNFRLYLVVYVAIVLIILFYIIIDFRIIKKRIKMKDSFIDTIIKDRTSRLYK